MESLHDAKYYIDSLHLEPHSEGGYFCQTYLKEDQSFSSIYFLLETGDVSHFHQLKEDEVWYFHDGVSLTIYEITEDGELFATALGRNIAKGEKLQHLVKAGHIFAAELKEAGFTLVGCMVCPAFSYEHFKLFTQVELLEKYPQHAEIIKRLSIK